MSTIKVDVSSSKKPVLQVGYQGENEVTDVLFDISAWAEEYGGGTAGLRVKRPQNSEEESYELSLPISENVATWTVSETDTYNKGNGKVQLKYYVGSALKKSDDYTYKVGKSIVGSDNPVDPFDTWIERSKAWATGELLDGEDVPASDETYHNNAKYYAEQSGTQAEEAEAQAVEAKAQADTAKQYAHQFVGAPRAAAAAADMTDHDLIYVFTGTTTSSLTNGHWYYWNGSAWTDGGVYNSTAFTTDTTLSVAGAAADAKVVGDLKEDFNFVSDKVLKLVDTINTGTITSGTSLTSANMWFNASPVPANCMIKEIAYTASDVATGVLEINIWEERTAGTLTKVKYIESHPNAVGTLTKQPVDFITKYPTYISFHQMTSILKLTIGGRLVKYIANTSSESIILSSLTNFNGTLNITVSYYTTPPNDENIIHIGENLQFEEIQDALDSVQDSASNPYTFIIHPKATPYNRFSMIRRLSDPYPWTNAPLRYISMIGIDKYRCVIEDDTGDYAKPSAEILTNGLIKNLTFVATHNNQSATAQKGAYAVHIDAEPVDNDGYDMCFEECVFKSDQTAGVGIGMHNKSHLTFRNCEFLSTASESYNPHQGYTNLTNLGAFNAHSSTNTEDTDQILTLIDCVAVSKENKAYNLSTNVNCYMTFKAYCNTFWCEGTGQANGWYGSYVTFYGANHGNNVSVFNA